MNAGSAQADQCLQCAVLQKQLAAATAQIQQLRQQVAELKARLNQNSSNSSRPPSSDPPSFERRAQAPSGRAPGGQKGHPGHCRRRLPPERIDQVVQHLPSHCQFCQARLPQKPSDDDPAPRWHQVAEIPPLAASITEHQAHARRCRKCGRITFGQIPASIGGSAFGPRLSGLMSYLAARCHDGKRLVQEFLQSVLGVPVGLGTVCAREQEMSKALARPYQQIKTAVRQASVKNADETRWKQGAKLRWLWVAATRQLAVFRISRRRNRQGLQLLLGQQPQGTLISDRLGAYHLLGNANRQVCWAHLKRDFEAFAQRGLGLGAKGLAICSEVFGFWRDFRQRRRTRQQLQEAVRGLGRRLRNLLLWWAEHPERGKASVFAQHLLNLEPALWTFAYQPGVEPDNNHAERMLRPAVLWRKNCFGCQSAQGRHFVQRMLSVVQSLRLQQRNVLEFLCQCIQTYRCGQPPPSPIP
jgi:transposase